MMIAFVFGVIRLSMVSGVILQACSALVGAAIGIPPLIITPGE